MKKINFLLTALLLGTAATWAAGLSFTIYPEASGTFQIYYSTYNAPSGNCVIVDWGNGSYVYSEADTGSNPSKSITGTVTVGKPIKIYCDYIDAIQINSRANFIKCEPNNPQLQYIYYFFDNLSPENLEALYLSLISRNGKDDYGELHLSQTASIETASTNILKSNAFIPEGLNWRVCSMRSYTGSSRTNWKLDEVNCKKYLIPAITITTSTTANITDLQLGIKQSAQLPWNISSSTVRIDDGTSNHKSVNVLSYSTSTDFVNNAPKLTVKGMGADKIKIYGALVSHFKTTSGQITNNINFDNTTNLRYIYTANNNQIGYIWGLRYQILLEELYLKNMPNTGSFEDLDDLTKLKVLNVGGCRSITRLYFNKTNIESLDFTDCEGLDPYSISLFPAPKLKSIGAAGLGWDACEMDVFYSRLPSNAASDAKVWVNDVYANGNQNNSYGSNKIIANDSGWKVWSAGLTSDSELTGDGGGCTTGISQAEAAKFISVFPNPATDVVNITLVPNLNAESLQVIDFTGKTVFTMPVSPSKSEYQINVSNYSKGVYLIRVGSITHKMLVK